MSVIITSLIIIILITESWPLRFSIAANAMLTSVSLLGHRLKGHMSVIVCDCITSVRCFLRVEFYEFIMILTPDLLPRQLFKGRVPVMMAFINIVICYLITMIWPLRISNAVNFMLTSDLLVATSM